MDDRKTVSIYHLVIIAIVLLAALALVVLLNRICVPSGSAAKPPAGKTAAPAGEIERSYNIPPNMTVNLFPGDEEIKKKIEERVKRQEILKEKIANRDKRAAIVRAKVIAIQDEMLSNEIKNAQQTTVAFPKTVSTVTNVKKGPSNKTGQKALPEGHHFGH